VKVEEALHYQTRIRRIWVVFEQSPDERKQELGRKGEGANTGRCDTISEKPEKAYSLRGTMIWSRN